MANRNKKVQKKYEDTKPSKRNTKSRAKADLDEVKKGEKDYKLYSNDASWYIPDENLRRQVGSFAFNNTIGIATPLQFNDQDEGSKFTNPVLGNIMSIGMFPWIGEPRNELGIASDKNALAMAALKIYTKISAVNSKTTQYQPQNLAIAMLAIGDIISTVAYLQRAYGVAFSFNPRNRTIPRALIKAMGIDPDSLLDDLSGFRLKFNTILTKASNIRMLRDVKYFTKCWEIYSHIFYDKNSAMGQYYVTRPEGYLELNEDAPELGALVFSPFGNPGTTKSATQCLSYLDAMVTRVLESSTFNYIFTDIVNYVTKEGGELLGFSYLPELYQVIPEFSEEFMTQVHNMDWGLSDLSDYQIFDEPESNSLRASEIWKRTGDSLADAALYGDKILDFPYTDMPTVDDVINACMYKIASNYTIRQDGITTAAYIAAPDHPVHSVYMINTLGNEEKVSNTLANQWVTDASGNFSWGYINDIIVMDTFDIRPIFYISRLDKMDSFALVPEGQLNFWTNIKYAQLANMFQYAFLGLFDVEVKSINPFK